MSTFGDRLREARTAAGLTQEQFGFRVGVTNSAVSAWENGRDVPSFPLLAKLREATGRSLDELICGESSQAKAKVDAIARSVGEVPGVYAAEDTPRARDSKEVALLIRFRSMTAKGRDALLELLKPKE